MGLSCYDLLCDSLSEPLGIDSARPGFSWKIQGSRRGIRQEKYRLRVYGGGTEWDSGIVDLISTRLAYEGVPLKSRTRYVWDVTIWDDEGMTASGESFFETAFMEKESWRARWIEPDQTPAYHEPYLRLNGFKNRLADLPSVRMNPAQMIRKDFVLEKSIKWARAYVCAHGVYYLELNGRRVGDVLFAPGYSSYEKYLEYQTYDIADLLETGGNAIGIVVGDGWYCGKVGMPGGSCQFGDTLAVLFQLEIEYDDGCRHTVYSDGTCRGSTGPIKYSDFFVGEKYDATCERSGFSVHGFADADWKNVSVRDAGYENLRAQNREPVRVCETIKPKNIRISPKGEVILDAGSVVSGFLRMRVKGDRGTRITLEHTETIDRYGNYFFNIQGVFPHQTDIYVLKGEGIEYYEPSFTYHGFRYVRITGYPGMPTVDDFEVRVVRSDMRETGFFSCSDERINRLQANIVRSQRSNMISVPTDCPQREKQGWTGDAQVFAPTACFNMGMEAFFRIWLKSMKADQKPDGQIPFVIPNIQAYSPGFFPGLDSTSSAGWGDAAVIIPWVLYQYYGDISILEENYEMMRKWVEYIRHTAETELPAEVSGKMTPERGERMKYLWNTNNHLGDWLTPSVSIDLKTGDVDMRQSALRTKDIVPSCFFAYSTDLLSRIASILGKNDDAFRYADLNVRIKKAFAEEYIDGDGNLKTELQGIYVLALKMDLLPGSIRKKAVDRLVQLIRENGNRLDTGFLSTPFLLDVLCDEGRFDVACDILFQEECPSWLYEVKMGATAIWESWQAVLPDGKLTSVSHNHYAFGCVGDWMYRVLGGLRSFTPGYSGIEIKPELDGRITFARTSFYSVNGLIVVDWKVENGIMRMTIDIPANTSAIVYLPKARLHNVTESGVEIQKVKEITGTRQETAHVVCSLVSGQYEFRYNIV